MEQNEVIKECGYWTAHQHHNSKTNSTYSNTVCRSMNVLYLLTHPVMLLGSYVHTHTVHFTQGPQKITTQLALCVYSTCSDNLHNSDENSCTIPCIHNGEMFMHLTSQHFKKSSHWPVNQTSSERYVVEYTHRERNRNGVKKAIVKWELCC